MKSPIYVLAALAAFSHQAHAFTQSVEACQSHAALVCSNASGPSACAKAAFAVCDGIDGTAARFPDPTLHVKKSIFGAYSAWISPGKTETFVSVQEDGGRPAASKPEPRAPVEIISGPNQEALN